jgi:hypothetical protein
MNIEEIQEELRSLAEALRVVISVADDLLNKVERAKTELAEKKEGHKHKLTVDEAFAVFRERIKGGNQ